MKYRILGKERNDRCARDVAGLAEVSPANFLFEKLTYYEIDAKDKVEELNRPALGACKKFVAR